MPFLFKYVAHMNARKAEQKDFTTLKQLMLQALQSDPTAFTVSYNEYNQNSDYWWHMYLDAYLIGTSAEMLFAEVGEKIVGMVGVLYSTKERTKHVATIVWFYVVPEFRSQKIGSTLINNLVQTIKSRPEIKKINLTVISNQVQAISLYKHLGFSEVGRQNNELLINDNYYDFLMMELFIKPI